MGNGKRGQRGSGKATVAGLKVQLAKTVSNLHTAEHKRERQGEERRRQQGPA